MTTTTSHDTDVQRLLELQETRERIDAETAEIKTRLAASLTPGSHGIAGVTVTVSAPSRRFNVDKAWEALPESLRAVCVSPDAKKIKANLAPTVVDAFMEPGVGNPVVKVQ